MNSELVPVADDPRVPLQRRYDEALGLLTGPQRKYVENLVASGDPKAAAVEAGFARVSDAVRRLRANALVRRAVEAGTALREAASPITRDRARGDLSR